jgi:hypothetical protein
MESAIYPGVNARISAYIGFIEEATCQLSDFPPSYCNSGEVLYTPGATTTDNDNSTDTQLTFGSNSTAFKADTSEAENATAPDTDSTFDANVTMATNDTMPILNVESNNTDLAAQDNDEMANAATAADSNSTMGGEANATDDASLDIDAPTNVTSNDTLISDMAADNAGPLANGETDLYNKSLLSSSSAPTTLFTPQPTPAPSIRNVLIIPHDEQEELEATGEGTAAGTDQTMIFGVMAVAFVLLLACVITLRRSLMNSEDPKEPDGSSTATDTADSEKPEVGGDEKSKEEELNVGEGNAKDLELDAGEENAKVVEPKPDLDSSCPGEDDSSDEEEDDVAGSAKKANGDGQSVADDETTEVFAGLTDAADEPTEAVKTNQT